MMEPGTERELDYTERTFKKVPGLALKIARLFLRGAKRFIVKPVLNYFANRKENRQRAFITQLCHGKDGKEIKNIIQDKHPEIAKLIGPKERGFVGRMIDKVRGITPEAREKKLLQQPLHKFDTKVLNNLMTNDVISNKINSDNKFKGSIDPIAREVYKSNLLAEKTQNKLLKKQKSQPLKVGNTMSGPGKQKSMFEVCAHAKKKAPILTAEKQRSLNKNSLTKDIAGRLSQMPLGASIGR
ncbi:hypothetical protein ACIJDO_002205 [Enterococcus hirae]